LRASTKLLVNKGRRRVRESAVSSESQHRHHNIISSAGTIDAPISKRPAAHSGRDASLGRATRDSQPVLDRVAPSHGARGPRRGSSRRLRRRLLRLQAGSLPRLDQENNNPPACADPLFRPHPAPQRRRRALRRRPPRARQRFVLVRVRVPQSPAVPARARRQRQPAQPNLGSAGECRRVGRPGPFPRSVGEARPGIAALKSPIPPVSSTASNKPTAHTHPPLPYPTTNAVREGPPATSTIRADG